jgi:plastocyanin/methionine-rich copper-binding protein CopC
MKYALAILIVGVVILICFALWQFSSTTKTDSVENPQQLNRLSNVQPSQSNPATAQNTFSNPKKSAHYETNTPEHGATLAGVPANVVIDFNFDLAKPSEIKILKDSKEYGIEETVIDSNKLSMRKKMDPASPDGMYRVEYNACWPDGSCHDGNFQFVIDRTLSEKYEDQLSKKEITIKMSQIKFMPMDLKIKRGTTVTWVNDDSVTHYVNTDSHPAHTYQKNQNSKALEKGETYQYTFDEAGIYPYHCSAHAENMTGNILVVE